MEVQLKKESLFLLLILGERMVSELSMLTFKPDKLQNTWTISISSWTCAFVALQK